MYNHDSYCIEMPEQPNKIIKYNPREKSLKAPFAIYIHLECLFKKYNLVKNTLKNLMQRKNQT